MKKYLEILFNSKSLTRDQAFQSMNEVLAGSGNVEQIAAFLGALRAKGETRDEIVGFAQAIREKSVRLPRVPKGAIDTCGTGGDQTSSFNISTAASFVLAAAGVTVAKHGNRSVSSRCGSADVIEALGLKADGTPEEVATSLERHQFGFLFAPSFHPVLKNVGPIRKSIGVKTVFNLLGPLVNPAQVQYQVMGVFDPKLCRLIAEVLRELGCVEAMVFSSVGGMDELSVFENNRICVLKDSEIHEMELSPSEIGIQSGTVDELKGGDALQNAALIEEILRGEMGGVRRDVVALNAGAGLVVAGLARGLKEGYLMATEILHTGRPFEVLQKMKIS